MAFRLASDGADCSKLRLVPGTGCEAEYKQFDYAPKWSSVDLDKVLVVIKRFVWSV